MRFLSVVWGVLAILGMMLGFIPLLGWLNWVVIPFAGAGAIFSGVLMANSQGGRGASTLGLAMCAIALCFGAVRLFIGGGIL